MWKLASNFHSVLRNRTQRPNRNDRHLRKSTEGVRHSVEGLPNVCPRTRDPEERMLTRVYIYMPPYGSQVLFGHREHGAGAFLFLRPCALSYTVTIARVMRVYCHCRFRTASRAFARLTKTRILLRYGWFEFPGFWLLEGMGWYCCRMNWVFLKQWGSALCQCWRCWSFGFLVYFSIIYNHRTWPVHFMRFVSISELRDLCCFENRREFIA